MKCLIDWWGLTNGEAFYRISPLLMIIISFNNLQLIIPSHCPVEVHLAILNRIVRALLFLEFNEVPDWLPLSFISLRLAIKVVPEKLQMKLIMMVCLIMDPCWTVVQMSVPPPLLLLRPIRRSKRICVVLIPAWWVLCRRPLLRLIIRTLIRLRRQRLVLWAPQLCPGRVRCSTQLLQPPTATLHLLRWFTPVLRFCITRLVDLRAFSAGTLWMRIWVDRCGVATRWVAGRGLHWTILTHRKPD